MLTQEGESKVRIIQYSTASGAPEVGTGYRENFHSQGTRNIMGPYSNPQVDKLTDQAGASYDQKERAALYQRAATMIREDMPAVPLFMGLYGQAVSVKVRNYVPIYDGPLRQSYAEFWLAP